MLEAPFYWFEDTLIPVPNGRAITSDLSLDYRRAAAQRLALPARAGLAGLITIIAPFLATRPVRERCREASPEGSEGEGGRGRMERAGEGSAQSGAIVRQ
jgi:hypothetical protein